MGQDKRLRVKKSIMEEKVNFIEPLFVRAEAFGKTSYELYKLRAVDKTALVASTFISRGAAILFLSIFTVSANIGIALWLGDILGKNYYGFFCVAGFYGLLGVVIYFFMNDWIKNRVSNSIISQLLN
ncbi:hypothetical protein BH10BAC1_BH10BAC1_02300 [soil metagenome]